MSVELMDRLRQLAATLAVAERRAGSRDRHFTSRIGYSGRLSSQGHCAIG